MRVSTKRIIDVDGGRVAGVLDRGVHVFKGIPYATPPVGVWRWKPPRPVTPWSGVRDGSTCGAECPQPQYPPGSIYIRPLQPQSEDCLFLNVWTPAEAGGRLPVLVWIHGGALTYGSGISDVRDGVPLARKGIVLVSLNYRLGALGYLAHPWLTAESPQHSSGNYGVLDQIAALQWVQRNVERFGGDPAKVTIAGESAGSWSVNTLMASPLSAGLFRGAIGQSGGRFSRTPHLTQDRGSQASAEAIGIRFAQTQRVESLAALRELPAHSLIEVDGFRSQENLDGWVLPDEIRAIFENRQHHNVPVIVGSTADEMTPFGLARTAPQSLGELRRWAGTHFRDLTDDFEAAYDVRHDADAVRAFVEVARDTTFSSHMRNWARHVTAAGSHAFLYYFTYAPPAPQKQTLGAFHAGEIPYVFNVIPSGDPREGGFSYTDYDLELADRMSSYWVNFVATGDPNGPGLPVWPVFDPVTEPYLDFGTSITTGTRLLKPRLDFLELALART
jgi:para-nitrobenzyl esterase